MRICSVVGCEKKHDSHGYCGMHAMRVKRYGDVNYITPPNVASMNSRLAQPNLGKCKPHTYHKYLGRHHHRVVAEEMLGRKLKRGEIVHHRDGNKRNNSPGNLEVMTQSQHMRIHMAEMKYKRAQKLVKINFSGKDLPVSEWARITGVPLWTIIARLKRGWPVGKALTYAPDSSRRIAFES